MRSELGEFARAVPHQLFQRAADDASFCAMTISGRWPRIAVLRSYAKSAPLEWFRGFSSYFTPSRSASLIMSIA